MIRNTIKLALSYIFLSLPCGILPSQLIRAEESSLPIREIQELAEVLDLIQKNHVIAKSDRELLLAAIDGMLKSLDPQSRYLNADELKLFTQVATGNHGGQQTTNGHLINNQIIYLDIDYFHASTAATITDFWQRLSQQSPIGLIIDLRDNPGGFVEAAVEVADLFVTTGTISTARGRVPEAAQNYDATENSLSVAIPVVVLINEHTASAAEIVAAALQDHKLATLVGTTTYGKASIQSLMKTQQGAIQLTTAYYYTPRGRLLENIGIQPDVVLSKDMAESPQFEYDQVTDHADEWLNWAVKALQDGTLGAKN